MYRYPHRTTRRPDRRWDIASVATKMAGRPRPSQIINDCRRSLAREDLDRSEGRRAGRPRFDGPLLPIGSGIGVVGGVGIEPTRGRAIEWTRPAPVLPSGTWRESHSCIKEIGGKRETPRTGRLIRDSSHSTERGAVGQTRTADGVDADAARRAAISSRVPVFEFCAVSRVNLLFYFEGQTGPF